MPMEIASPRCHRTMLNAPAPVQAQLPQLEAAAAMREAKDSATKAATIAMTIDKATSLGSNVPS